MNADWRYPRFTACRRCTPAHQKKHFGAKACLQPYDPPQTGFTDRRCPARYRRPGPLRRLDADAGDAGAGLRIELPCMRVTQPLRRAGCPRRHRVAISRGPTRPAHRRTPLTRPHRLPTSANTATMDLIEANHRAITPRIKEHALFHHYRVTGA